MSQTGQPDCNQSTSISPHDHNPSAGGDLEDAAANNICTVCNTSADEEDNPDGDDSVNKEAQIAKPIKRGLSHNLPTEEEREQHMLTHEPFRSWCPHCTRGKCVAGPHLHKVREPGALSTLHCDYCFLVKCNKDEGKESYDARSGSPIMVTYDSGTKSLSAHYVVQKGVHPWPIRVLKVFLERLAYKRMLYRTDQENSIQALMREVGKQTSVELVPEESKAYDSPSNGVIEAMVQSFEKAFRTLRDALESRLSHRLPDDHPAFSWLASHTAKTINRYRIGGDGLTAHQRVTGKPFRTSVLEFGEFCFGLLANTKSKDKGNARSWWTDGVFLGVSDQSGELLLAVQGGVIKVRDVVRRTDPEERWSYDKFTNIVTNPMWRPNPDVEDPEVHIQVRVPRIEEPVVPIDDDSVSSRRVHRFHIRGRDALRRGLWADRCLGCRCVRDGLTAQGHSEECRASIEKMLNNNSDPRVMPAITRMFTQHVNRDLAYNDDKADSRAIKRTTVDPEAADGHVVTS